MSWLEYFNKTIAKFKEGQPVDDFLEVINNTTHDFELNERLEEAGIEFYYSADARFLCPLKVKGSDSPFGSISSMDSLFDLFENYYPEVNPKNEFEVLETINGYIESYIGDSPPHLDILHRDDVILSCLCDIHGQNGPNFTNFNIFNSIEESREFYVNKGWFIESQHDEMKSHSDSQLIAMFKEYVVTRT